MKQPKEKYAHYGLYMVVMSLLVLAIVVLGNGIAHRLPVSWTQFDTSASRLYSLSPQTEEIAAGLTEDVTLYLVAPTGEEDETLLRLLQKYEALSEHITTSTVDPVLSPTFVQTYTSAKVSDNSILVVGAERSRVIRNSDLYPSNYDYDTGRTSTEFDGEGQITSAIYYVTSDAVSKIYLVTGHGEDALSESFTAALEKEGVAQESLNLTTVSQIPEDAGCLFFNVPVSDLSEGEAAVLTSYLEQGGRMVLISGITSAQMPNLDRVLSAYGVAAAQGMIVESDSNGAIPSYPNFLLPQIRSHAITDPFLQENGLLLLPNAHAIVHLDEVRSTVSIEDLLVTSEASYLKTDTSTLSYQEGDLTGPLSVGVAITEDTAQGETKLVWFSSSTLLAEDFDEMVGGNNTDLVLNAIGWMTEQDNGISIRPKATSSTSLRLTGAQAAGWAVLFVLVIPLIVLAVGIIFFVRRRKKQKKKGRYEL